MYSNWPCRRRCSDGISSRGCPSDGSSDDDDDVTTPEEKEWEEDDPNKKNDGNTASVGVHGYESVVQPSTVINNSSSLLPQRSSVGGLKYEYHHARLNGLCQHAIVRLWALIREEELKWAGLHGVRRATAKESDESSTGERDRNNIFHDAIAKLIYNDLIRDAYLHGSSKWSSSSTHQHPYPLLRSLNSSSDSDHWKESRVGDNEQQHYHMQTMQRQQ